MIRKIIEGTAPVRFDRAHFKEFVPYSLDFEIVYFVLAPDFNQYMDIQEKINLMIKETFDRQGIEFAYPTQVEYVKSGP